MSLRLTGSREHALLALVAEEAGKVLRGQSGYLGRTAMQKIVYLLQVCEVPMRYRFDVHYYGPYCDGISRDIEWLLADKVLVDHAPEGAHYSNYRCGHSAEEILRRHPELEAHRDTVRSVVNALLPLDPARMELITTLDFAFRQLRAGHKDRPDKQAVLQRFRAFKGEKFAEAEVSDAYDCLANAGVVG